MKGINLGILDGQITVLDNHLPLIAITRPGEVTIIDENNNKNILELSSAGFLEIKPENHGAVLLLE